MTMPFFRSLLTPTLVAAVTISGASLGTGAPDVGDLSPVETGSPATGVAAAPDPRTSFSYQSEPGDYIGQGQSETYRPSDPTTIEVSGTRDHLEMSLSSADDWWNLSLSPGRGDVLRPGVFLHAERDPFRTGRSPGLSFSGNGRGCNEVYGEFTVDQIAFDGDGDITMVDVTFVQNCESADAPALRGTLLFEQLPLRYEMRSEPGDYIGQGESNTYTNSRSILTASGDKMAVSASVSGERDDWSIRLAAPTGTTLRSGRTYDTARFADETRAGLDVTGNGRGCNQSTGRLTVKKIVVTDGAVTHLHARFVQYCDGSGAALRGTFRYFA